MTLPLRRKHPTIPPNTPGLNRVSGSLLLFAVACLPLPVAAQNPEPVLGTAAAAQEEPVQPAPRTRDSLGLPESFDPDSPFLGDYERMDNFGPSRRASTPADLPKIDTILPLAMEPEPGEFPEEVLLGDEPWVPRHWDAQSFAWEASGLQHQPLYFEDLALERYGHSFGIFQPAASWARFHAQLIALPYRLLTEPPCDCEYTLGYYRPGDCAPRLYYRILKKDFGKHRRQRDRRHHYHVVHPTQDHLQIETPTYEVVDTEPTQIAPRNTPPASDATPIDQGGGPALLLNPVESAAPGKATPAP